MLALANRSSQIMPMNTFSEAFIEGFISTCVYKGVPENAACELLKKAQEREMALEDPDWKKGFAEALEKAASMMPDAFSAPPKGVGDFGMGAGLGGLGGLGLAALALGGPRVGLKAVPALGRKALTMSWKKPTVDFFSHGVTRGMRDVPLTRITNKLIRAGKLPPGSPAMTVPKPENYLKYLLRRSMGTGNAVLAGGAGAGALAGGAANAATGALPGTGFGLPIPGKDNWLPSYIGDVPAGGSAGGAPAAGPSGGYPGAGSVWRQPGGFATDLGPGGGVGGQSGPTYSNSRFNSQELRGLDSEISQLQSQLSVGGGIMGASGNQRVNERMRQLLARRAELASGIAQETGGLRRDQARAGQGIADKLKQVERAIRTREVNAQGASSWMESSQSPGFGGAWRRGLNSITGFDSGAGQLDAELRQLYDMRKQLQAEQARVGNII